MDAQRESPEVLAAQLAERLAGDDEALELLAALASKTSRDAAFCEVCHAAAVEEGRAAVLHPSNECLKREQTGD